YERQGFRYYEFRFSQPYVGGRFLIGPPEGRVVHIEKQRGEWKATALGEPRARYYFKLLRSDERVGHKIWVTAEYAILDSQTGESIARDIRYGSLPNKVDLWWMRMLGDPTRYCPGWGSKSL